MLKAYLHTKEYDGRGGFTCYLSREVPVKMTDTPRSGRTASGYGRRLPTQYMVMVNKVWRRVYCICMSNSGTLFIGKSYDQKSTIDITND